MLYPTPTTIVATVVDGKVNFLTIAHVGIMNFGKPEYISISPNKIHHSNTGIKEHGTFSVNIPGEDLIKETDYVGIISGKKNDKSAVFETFSGELENAPMIERCPINMECRLYKTVDFPKHDLFIGEIVETYVDEEVETDGKVDFAKVKPLLFDMPQAHYWKLGDKIAKCWNVGKELKK